MTPMMIKLDASSIIPIIFWVGVIALGFVTQLGGEAQKASSLRTSTAGTDTQAEIGSDADPDEKRSRRKGEPR
jgi:hypothetical protein